MVVRLFKYARKYWPKAQARSQYIGESQAKFPTLPLYIKIALLTLVLITGSSQALSLCIYHLPTHYVFPMFATRKARAPAASFSWTRIYRHLLFTMPYILASSPCFAFFFSNHFAITINTY